MFDDIVLLYCEDVLLGGDGVDMISHSADASSFVGLDGVNIGDERHEDADPNDGVNDIGATVQFLVYL